ncbi:ABC transporter substrate-binding protein [Wenyingzhuangia sp. 1_MG-2023]|nr:ABC transporter substrate-binding protein [Wenyingzhuangia sp. 1_MG-2023]
MKKIISFLVLILSLISCQEEVRTYDDTQVFRYNEKDNITTLDPAFAKNEPIYWATNQLFNGLVVFDDELNVEPCIAKSWEISNENKTYQFTLRKDVYFHKNAVFGKDSTRTVTASDFEYSFTRLMDPKVASSGRWVMQNVKSFKAINDSIFRIDLHQAFPPFLGLLSMQYCSVVPKEAIEFYGSEFRSNPVGTGPFQFKIWIENTKLVFRRNPLYFEKDEEGKQLPYLEAIAVTFYADKQTEFMQFIQGKSDVLNDLHTSYKDELLSPTGSLLPKYQDKLLLDKSPYLITEYIAFFMEGQTVDNHPYIRKAINCGFDRAKMLRYLRNNIGQPATGFIPKGLPSYYGDTLQTYYPEKAKAYIEKYKQETGDEHPTVKIATNSSYTDLFEFIQRELQGIGLTIELDILPSPVLRQKKANGNLPTFRVGWIADYPDAENFLSLFYSKNFSPQGPNYSHYSNPEYDKLYEESLALTDRHKRIEVYKKMDSIINVEVPVVSLFYDEIVRFKHKNVKGLTTNPTNLLNLKKVYKTKK